MNPRSCSHWISSAVNCWNYRFNSEEARAIDRLQLDMYNEIRQVHIMPDHDSSENQMRKNYSKLHTRRDLH